MTVNISRSGVLFAAEDPVSAGLAVEIWFNLPVPDPEVSGAQVIGSGFIVRSNEAAEPPQLAVRLHHYTMARANAPS